jgi:Zn-dependent peptidase ImmA (M78 family)/DNA-binding XRE family transcriptional regulator
MKNRFNGNRLKEALQYRGKRMAELTGETGISRQSLSAYANGTNKPRLENVLAIANALHFPLDYFMQDDLPHLTTETTYFRSQASATKMSREEQKAKMKQAISLFDFLNRNYIDYDDYVAPEISTELTEISDTPEMYQQIECIADEVRAAWGLGRGPIESVQNVLELHGIIVTGFPVSNNDKIDAFSQKLRNEEGKDIFIVALGIGQKPIQRLRFDMSHELGHIILHSWEDSDDELQRDRFNLIEKQANIFASAFLLPRESFIKDIGKNATDLNRYRELKRRWNVSMQAMIYRAWQIEAISSTQFQYMMRQFSKNGWRKKEPGDRPADINDTVYKIAIKMLFEGGYLTPDSLKNKLFEANIGLGTDDLEELMHLDKGTLTEEERPSKIIDLNSVLKRGEQ